ncbi:hypothetical protein [Siccirubricoccus sp. G192]|uniref:hypothetical protein n=1 Tax=Siccirubricoccus sp. G192 TaxID=2849651 RepID=UPI001C2C4117|nr:hypothetical protein [Siccirubricoccus sp. G192]MBV1796262.1 hypothetical protein [Siccirubricoccus sp. G192]
MSMRGLAWGVAAVGALALGACTDSMRQQPTNVGSSAAAPIVPGTGRIMGGLGNAEVQRSQVGAGAQAPIVPGTGQIVGGGTGNASIQRTPTGQGVQAPIVRGTGQINGGLGNAEVQRLGGGAPPP